jgi:hypothetical protein
MRFGDSGRILPCFCPAVEALLVHERTIVPQVAIARARALARARAALRAGNFVALANPPMPERGWRLRFAVAAGVVFLASAAAAYQVLRRPGPPSPGGESPQLMQTAKTVPPRVVELVRSGNATPVCAARAANPIPAKALEGRPASMVAEELRLLEHAQQSAARGDYAAVLAVTSEHVRRYAGGRLCEEREALRLRALIGLGRDDEARKAAVRFRHDFPRSVLLLNLDDMLDGGAKVMQTGDGSRFR